MRRRILDRHTKKCSDACLFWRELYRLPISRENARCTEMKNICRMCVEPDSPVHTRTHPDSITRTQKDTPVLTRTHPDSPEHTPPNSPWHTRTSHLDDNLELRTRICWLTGRHDTYTSYRRIVSDKQGHQIPWIFWHIFTLSTLCNRCDY